MHQKYIIQVAPVIPLPILRTQVFSYWHEEPLPVGTLVTVPFYFREIQGIVISHRQNILKPESLKLKSIKYVNEKNLLTPLQTELAKKISEYYFSPLGSVLKLMIPKKVKKRNKAAQKSKKSEITRQAGQIAMKILKGKKNKFLLMGSAANRKEIEVDLIRENMQSGKQCLILVPEIFFSQGVYEKLRNEFQEEIALIHSRTTKGQLFDWWQKIKNRELRLVISSKLGIFLPFSDLGLIIVQDEQDISFKQSKAMPRYSAVKGAEFLSELHGAKLIFSSSIPSVESFYRSQNGQFEFFDLNRGSSNCSSFEITTLEQEKKEADFPISKNLYADLANILEQKKQAVIFVNRRGFSTRTMCDSCKNILRCRKCRIALVYSEADECYRCLHCSFKMDLLSSCPVCGGSRFSHRGIGTQTVERKIKKLFPSAKIARLDADTTRSMPKNLTVLEKFSNEEIDILIGTQSAIKGVHSENVALVAAVSQEDLITGDEYNARGLAYSRFFHMKNLLEKNGKFLVQKYFENSPVLDMFSDLDLEKYYAKEIEIRKKFAYPPFKRLIKLACRANSKKSAKDEACRKIDLLFATSNNEIEIVGPYESTSSPKIGMYEQNILIKADPSISPGGLSIRAVLGGIKKGWIVDVDPASVL